MRFRSRPASARLGVDKALEHGLGGDLGCGRRGSRRRRRGAAGAFAAGTLAPAAINNALVAETLQTICLIMQSQGKTQSGATAIRRSP